MSAATTLALEVLKRAVEHSFGSFRMVPAIEEQARAAITALEAEAVQLAADFPARIMDILVDVARRESTEFEGPWEDGNGEPLQDDADAAIKWIADRAIAQEPVGTLEIWTDGTSGYPQYDLAIKPETVASLGDGVHDVYAAPQPAPEWIPIELAPRDGTKILGLTKDGDVYAVAYDDIFSAPWRVINDFGFSAKALTNWQPLPAAPRIES